MSIATTLLRESEAYKFDWALPHALEMRAVAQIGLRKFDGARRGLGRALNISRDQRNMHTRLNATVLAARIHLSTGSPERAVLELEGCDAPSTSSGMQGEYLATYALALACCGRAVEAQALVESSSLSTQSRG